MRINYLIIILMIIIAAPFYGQNAAQTEKATLIVASEKMIEMPSLASRIANGQFIPAEELHKEVNPKKRGANQAVPGKGLPIGDDPLWQKQTRTQKYPGREPILTFEATSAYVTPTDPTGAVGPDHFVNSWNSSFRIWDKEGNPLTAPASLGNIFPGHTMGDPIVIYDPFADRFLITEFYSNGFLVAICQGPDPVNDGWFTYQFPTNVFPDYPKFSLWSDGYYITSNKNSGTAGFSEVVYAIERDKMITGDQTALMIGFPLPGITTSGFFSPLGFNVNGSELPPPGDAPIVYMQDDVWSGVSYDHLKLWTIDVDWDTPSNSTISSAQEIATEPFDGLFDGGSFSNLPQPSGPDIDALQATVMYMAQYRRFDDHNAVVFNFVVDLDGGDDHAGIRWYELRQDDDGDPWIIYQEGTYAQPDGHSAFSGNMCMDVDGNIALAYSVVSNSQHPSLRYTGRYPSDPLGTMTLEEEVIVDGIQSNPSFRYGDYSQMTIDPIDDKTFWSIGEYFHGGARKNQVGVFMIAAELTNDVGISEVVAPVNGLLTAADTVKVTIHNYGLAPQFDIPVNYRINDGAVVSEIFTDTIESTESAVYTFETTGDFSIQGETYTIVSYSNLTDDIDLNNDTVVSYVTHLYPDDLGVVNLTAPETGTQLTESEEITVTLVNAGGAAQSNFDVTYVLDDGMPVTEQVAGPFEGPSTMEYTFNTTADFSELRDYELVAYTSLAGDTDTSNDTLNVTITSEFCHPEMDCLWGDGIDHLILGTIDNPSGCDEGGYGDYTDMSTNLWPGGTTEMVITTLYGNQYLKVWIDLNDNFVFEDDEVVIDNFLMAEGGGGGSHTEYIQMTIPGNQYLGEHLMRAKTNRLDSVPENACLSTRFGETEDYTVNIDNTTGLDNQSAEPNDLIVSDNGNNNFKVSFIAKNVKETLIISVHNLSGQTVIQNRVENVNGQYHYDFDMSYAAPGMYLVRLGSDTFGKVKKIVVR